MLASLAAQPAACRLAQRRSGSGPAPQQQQQAAALAPAWRRRRAAAPLRAAEPFNEGAAQVRRLVDRDRKELNLDALEASFAEDPAAAAAAAPSSAAEADGGGNGAARSPFQVNSSQADKTPVSPFGPSSSSAAAGSSPFGGSGAASKRPFAEPAGLSPNMPTPKQDTAPWWTKITLTQIVIVLSFTTIISLMVGTFFFVLSTGAIRFNE